MKLFIDTSKLSEIREADSLGIIDGVTTNPSLINKATDELKGVGIKSYIKRILAYMRGRPVSLEVISGTHEEMIKEGKRLYKLFNPVARNVYIKIPVNPSVNHDNHYDGIKAVKALSRRGIPVNCTLIFTPEQALLAAKAGAKLVSPFVGRVDDYIRKMNDINFKKPDYFPAKGLRKYHNNGIVSGVDLVKQCVEIFEKHNIKSKVLAASIRNARQLREVALVGAHIATVPFYVIKESLVHYKTKEGMINFTKDVIPDYAALFKE